MGSYTPNLGLFMPADTDFVDVTQDVANNMTTIDEALFEQCVLDVHDASWANQSIPAYRNKHTYNTWDGGIRVWDNKASNGSLAMANWQPTHGSPNEWTSLTPYLNGWTEVPGFKAYYRLVKEDTGFTENYGHLEFRGRLMLGTNYSPIVENTEYQVTKNMPVSSGLFPQLPAGGFGYYARVTMGNSPASTTIYNSGYVTMGADSTGLPAGEFAWNLQFYRKTGTNGTNAQTSGNTENYFCMDGVRLLVANGANL